VSVMAPRPFFRLRGPRGRVLGEIGPRGPVQVERPPRPFLSKKGPRGHLPEGTLAVSKSPLGHFSLLLLAYVLIFRFILLFFLCFMLYIYINHFYYELINY